MAADVERYEPASPSPGEPPERGEQTKPAEQFGPLAVVRNRKDDGRTLILYTRRRDGNDDHDATEDRPA